jgi:hypothetical protein
MEAACVVRCGADYNNTGYGFGNLRANILLVLIGYR